MKKTGLIGIIVVLAIVGSLFFFGQNRGQRVKIVREGDRAPEFQLATLDGKAVSLSSFRGKVVMVHFWATWCPPCVDEIPTLERLNRSFVGKDLAILAVSVEDVEAAALVEALGRRAQAGPVRRRDQGCFPVYGRSALTGC